MGWIVLGLMAFGLIWLFASTNREKERQEEQERQTGHDAGQGATRRHGTGSYGQRRPGGPTHRITYTDAEGNTTQRNIALYKSGHTNARFEAWCETRQERRTFLFERLQHAVDLSTGEVLNKAAFFSTVHPSRRVPDILKI